MDDQLTAVTLTNLAANLEGVAEVVDTAGDPASITVTSARIHTLGSDVPAVGELIIVPYLSSELPPLLTKLEQEKAPRTLAFCGWPDAALERLDLESSPHGVLQISNAADATTVITTLAHLTEPSIDADLRRLTALQRSLSQALDSTSPVTELLGRLRRQTNAVCLVIDSLGNVTESTGTLPLSILLEQIRKTDAPSQRLIAEKWQGHAVRLEGPDESQPPESGWLIVAARRETFPTTEDVAAAHISATLIEAAWRMQKSARAQEEAIRSSIFDEALDLEPHPEHPELVSRLAAVGFSFAEPLRVVAVTGTHPRLLSRSALSQIERTMSRILDSAETPYLVTTRGTSAIFLLQSDLSSITRLLHNHRDELSSHLVGIGRDVSGVALVPDAFADALIAIRTIQAGRHSDYHMAFEQFDFATRLFSSVGLERMAAYSREFLAPVLEREPMLKALRHYFELSQNTNAAANALGIHHNTLRYRLSKIETLLDLRLNEPAAVASLFLATTSLDLVDLDVSKRLTSAGPDLARDDGVTHTGITSPNAELNPSASITRARPPDNPQY